MSYGSWVESSLFERAIPIKPRCGNMGFWLTFFRGQAGKMVAQIELRPIDPTRIGRDL